MTDTLALSTVDDGDPGATDIGIVGASKSGKTFLLNSIIYRTQSLDHSGSLAYFLRLGVSEVWTGGSPDRLLPRPLTEITRDYRQWRELKPTGAMDQTHYLLELRYRVGGFGSTMRLRFFDGMGEEQTTKPDALLSFLTAQTMVFCVPAWALFPAAIEAPSIKVRQEERDRVSRLIELFYRLRKEKGVQTPVLCIIALTMADGLAVAHPWIQAQWLKPYMEDRSLLAKLGTGRGVMSYLRTARTTSERLHAQLFGSQNREEDPTFKAAAGKLTDIGGGPPWVIPVSAVDGVTYDRINAHRKRNKDNDPADMPDHPPNPVHVELPIPCPSTSAAWRAAFDSLWGPRR